MFFSVACLRTASVSHVGSLDPYLARSNQGGEKWETDPVYVLGDRGQAGLGDRGQAEAGWGQRTKLKKTIMTFSLKVVIELIYLYASV